MQYKKVRVWLAMAETGFFLKFMHLSLSYNWIQVRLIGRVEFFFSNLDFARNFLGSKNFLAALLTYFTLSKEKCAQIILVARALSYESNFFVRKFLKFRCCQNVSETSMLTENFKHRCYQNLFKTSILTESFQNFDIVRKFLSFAVGKKIETWIMTESFGG